jgi:hypothetical protein
MSRPKFLADNDLNEQIVAGVLRRSSKLEFPRVREFGFTRRNDAFLLEYAAEQGFIIVSHDVNTMTAAAYKRLAEGKHLAGLFMVPQTSPIGLIIDNLLLIWSASDAEDWAGQVTFLPLD